MTDDNYIVKLLSSQNEDHEDGPSRLWSTLKCARRGRLDYECGEQELFGPGVEGRNAGTITHKLVEIYHDGEDPELVVPTSSTHPDIEIILNGPRKKGLAAWPLFNKYEENFSADFWGHSVAAEVFLEGQIMGFRRTGRIDRIWWMDEETIERVEDRFPGLQLFGPGNYTWDLKTAASKDDSLYETWAWHPQPAQYVELARQHDYNPRGHIVFRAVGYKTDRQEWAFAVAYPADELLSTGLVRLQKQIAKAVQMKWKDAPGWTSCGEYGRFCPHRISGACQGV